MDEMINRLKTPEECIKYADRCSKLAQQARLRAIELRAQAYGEVSEVERELLKAIYAYEEGLSRKNRKRTRASRTWPMVKKYGIIGAAERAVKRKTDTMGYRLLVDMGFRNLTFEAVILQFSDSFDKQTVELASKRLQELEKTLL